MHGTKLEVLLENSSKSKKIQIENVKGFINQDDSIFKKLPIFLDFQLYRAGTKFLIFETVLFIKKFPCSDISGKNQPFSFERKT